MKTVTVEIEDGEVLVALSRPEGYEDVCDEIAADDMMTGAQAHAWRVVSMGESND